VFIGFFFPLSMLTSIEELLRPRIVTFRQGYTRSQEFNLLHHMVDIALTYVRTI